MLKSNFSQQNVFRIVFTSLIQKQSLNWEDWANISIVWEREYLSRMTWTFCIFLLRILKMFWFLNIGSEFGIEVEKQYIDFPSIAFSRDEKGRSFCRELSMIYDNEAWAKIWDHSSLFILISSITRVLFQEKFLHECN